MSDVMATNELFQNLMHGIRNDNYVEMPTSEQNTFTHRNPYTAQRLAIQELNSLLSEVVSDNVVEIDEIMMVSDWINSHHELQGNFPFDLIKDEISDAISNGLFSPMELRRLCSVFLYALDPITNPSPFSAAFTSTTPPIYESNICITGEFAHGERAEIEQIITESGATLCNNVTKKLNYLVIGSHGSMLWSEGNYGNKIKKALEYQRNNVPINILSEDAFFLKLEQDKAEQITLEGFATTDPFYNLLSDIVKQMRAKYRYYQIHKSGYYEMEKDPNLKPGDMVDILKISVNQNLDTYSLKIFGQIAVKIEHKKKYSRHISKNAYQCLGIERESSCSSIKNYIKFDISDMDMVLDICNRSYDYEIHNYIPANRFGCCSQYKECARQHKCLHENLFYAKGCYWREQIELQDS